MAEIIDKNVLKALSNETRQEIIKLMTKRPYTASELSKKLNKHVTTITEHLTILEKAGLVRRKDSTNKWVYYCLSEKGEKLFKPKYYSWVITLCLSVIVLFAGIYNLFIGFFSRYSAKEMTQSYMIRAETTQTGININLLLGIILIIAALIGFAYLIKKHKC